MNGTTEPLKALPLAALARELRSARLTSRELTDAMLARAAATGGEGARVFTRLYRDDAAAQAERLDALRAGGLELSPLMGLPMSIKDLFDVAGEVTTAGSRVLADAAPAAQDASVVARLRRAGAVLMGRTNMTEFAFSGLGLNPRHGTPRNPHDREAGRIPGGSSSGAAVSVTDGMSAAAIGTDTGGSVRIPAALCGLVGFKPTAARVAQAGTLPLAASLDSIGVIAPTVDCCARVDAVIADVPALPSAWPAFRPPRLGVPDRYVLEALDDTVAAAFARALRALERAGATVVEIPLPLDEIPVHTADGGLVAIEAYAWHETLLREHEADYDPRVASRILRGRGRLAVDYLRLQAWRRDWIARMGAALAAVDALAMPTVPVVAPLIAPLAASDDAYTRANLLLLRNPTVVNLLDGCAVSLPCHQGTELPTGLMIAGGHGHDARILSIAHWAEEELARAD